jgi:hypothetical protein
MKDERKTNKSYCIANVILFLDDLNKSGYRITTKRKRGQWRFRSTWHEISNGFRPRFGELFVEQNVRVTVTLNAIDCDVCCESQVEHCRDALID